MLNSKVFVFFIHAFASHWPLLNCQTITSLQSLPSRVFHLLIPCVTRPLLHLPPSVFLLSLSCSENIAWGFSLSVATRSLPGQWLLCTTPKVMGWAFLSRCPCRGSREQERGGSRQFHGLWWTIWGATCTDLLGCLGKKKSLCLWRESRAMVILQCARQLWRMGVHLLTAAWENQLWVLWSAPKCLNIAVVKNTTPTQDTPRAFSSWPSHHPLPPSVIAQMT